jgi:ribosome assembly protein RRB1
LNAKCKEPVIRYECVPHRGVINRLRTLHGSSIVATWSEDGEVGIYDV